MLKHPPQQLMLKSEKYFMKLVRHRRAPEDAIISLAPCGVLRWLKRLHRSRRRSCRYLLSRHSERFGGLGIAAPISYAHKALQNNASVKYTIGELARIEKRIFEEEKEERLARAIRENFSLYKDPDGFFSLAAPKDWHAKRNPANSTCWT
jgi:hypothetical protein